LVGIGLYSVSSGLGKWQVRGSCKKGNETANYIKFGIFF